MQVLLVLFGAFFALGFIGVVLYLMYYLGVAELEHGQLQRERNERLIEARIQRVRMQSASHDL